MVSPQGGSSAGRPSTAFVRSIRSGVRQAGDVALLLTTAVDAGIESSVALDSAILNVYEPRIAAAALNAANPLFNPCPDAESARLLGRLVAEQAFAFSLAVQVIAESRDISPADAVRLLNKIVEA